jgi:MFS family permease
VADRADPASERPGSYAVLRLPLYRRYLAAAISYSVGMWTFQTVLIWIVLEQTDSAASVSLLLICLTVAWLLFSLPSGILADRYDVRRLMLAGQIFGALSMGTAALATAAGILTPPLAMILIFILGISDAFYNVPGMVFVGRLVEPRLMAGAIGLSALQYGFGRILGGLVTGIAIASIGAAASLGLAALLFVVSFVIVLTLPSLPRLETSPGRASLRDLGAAVRWYRGSPPSIALVVLGLGAALFVYSYFTLLPIVAIQVLGAGSQGLGLLTSAGGLGVLVGSLLTDPVGRRLGRGRALLLALVVAAAAFAGLGLSNLLALSAVFTVALTLSLGIYRVTSQLLLQHLAPARMRGRVIAVFELSFWGTYPFGAMASGALADRFGAQAVIVTFAALTVIAASIALIYARNLIQLDVDREGDIVLDRRVAATGPTAPATAPDG